MAKGVKYQKSNRYELLKFPNTKIAYLVSGLILLVVLLVLFFILRGGSVTGVGVVMKVGDVAVYQDQYDAYIKSAKSLSLDEDQARQELVEYHKNRIILDSMDIPAPDEFVEAQWPLVLSRLSGDYLSSVKYQDRYDTPAGRVYSYNNYVDVLGVNADGKMYVGALYNFPYTAYTLDSELGYAESAQRSAVEMKDSFSDDVAYIKRHLMDIPSTSSSHTGLYLMKEDGSASLMGGSFGLRTGLIPSEMIEAVDDREFPYVSDVYHLEGAAYYVIRVLDSFEVEGGLDRLLVEEKSNIKVVEYDR